MADIAFELFPARVFLPGNRVYEKAKVVATPDTIHVFVTTGRQVDHVYEGPYASLSGPTATNRRYTFAAVEGEEDIYVARGAGCGCGAILKKMSGHELLSKLGVSI